MYRRLAQPFHALRNILLAAGALDAQHAELHLRLAMPCLCGFSKPFASCGSVASHTIPKQIGAGQIDLRLNHTSLSGLSEQFSGTFSILLHANSPGTENAQLGSRIDITFFREFL